MSECKAYFKCGEYPAHIHGPSIMWLLLLILAGGITQNPYKSRTDSSVTICRLPTRSSRKRKYPKEFIYPSTLLTYTKTILAPSIILTLRMNKLKTRNKHKAPQNIIIAWITNIIIIII